MTYIKPYLVILLSIVFQNIVAQDNDRSAYQTQLFTLAIKTSESGDYLEAIRTLATISTLKLKSLRLQ